MVSPVSIFSLNGFENENINFDELEELFKKSSNQMLKIKGKDLVLVVGNTGSGKSTVINYLLGNQMVKQIHKGKRVFKGTTQDETMYPKIGLSNLSETLYSSIYHDHKSNIYWCDCPGFGENRGITEEILAEMNLEIAIKLANSIKAIVIVINSHELDVKKGVALSQLNQKIFNIVKNFDEVIQSVLFVFTKIDENDMTREDLIEQIEQKIEDQAVLKQKSKSSWNLNDSEENNNTIEKYMCMLKLMSENKDKFFIINYSNNDVRLNLIQHVSKLTQSLSQEYFKFDTINDLRLKFNQFVFKVSHEGTCLIESRNDLKKFIVHSKNEVQRLNERVAFYANELNMISQSNKTETLMSKKESPTLGELSTEANMINEKIKSNETLKKAEQTRLMPILAEINIIERELSKLDSDETILYWKDSIMEKRLKINILGQTYCFGRTYKIFSYKDIPFEKVEQSFESGTFEIKEENKELGRFKAIYVSNAKEDGIACVKIYVKKKNKADVKYMISRTQDKLQKKNSEKIKYESVISKLDEENIQFVTILNNLKTTNLTTAAHKNSNDIELKKCKSRLETAKVELSNAENNLLICEEKLNSKNELFQMLALISENMDFSSLLLVDEFLKLKSDYIDNKNDLSLSSFFEFPVDFKCPIGQEIMDDPVTTPCCHTFDKMEITKYFRAGNKIVNCPICRTQISEKELKPNINLKSIIDSWKTREHDELTTKLFGSNSTDLTHEGLLERKKRIECQMLNLDLQKEHLKIEYKKVLDLIDNKAKKKEEIF